MSVKRRAAAIAGSLVILALAGSLAGNFRLWRQLQLVRKSPTAPAASVEVKTALSEPKPAARPAKKAPQSGYAAQLGPAPLFLKSAVFRNRSYHRPRRHAVLDFVSETDLAAAELTVTPELPDLKYEVRGTALEVTGRFVPGRKYRFTVRKGAKNRSGGVLEQDAVAEVTAPDRAPEIGFVGDGVYLPLHGGKFVLPFRTVNIDKVTVSGSQAYENNLNPYLRLDWAGDDRMVPVGEKRLEFRTPKNTEVYHELNLAELLGGRRPGVFRVNFDRGGEQYVSVTDLAVQVAEDRLSGKLSVFVRSLSTGRPVPDAEITVLSYRNQVAAAGRTDASGGAILTYDPAWAKESDRTTSVLVRHAGDFIFFPLEKAKTFASGGEVVPPGEPLAFVFAERGAARPGEKFTVSAFLRRDENGEARIMPDTPLQLGVTTPRGRMMFTRTLRSDKHGFAQTDIDLPDTAETGRYSLWCKAAGADRVCGRSAILVADYVPDRIRVTERALTEKAGVDTGLKFDFLAKYYFGPALENGNCGYTVSFDFAGTPAHWKGWTVGDRAAARLPSRITGRGQTSETGDFSFDCPGFAASGGKSFDPVRVTAELTAAEPGGRGVTGRAEQLLWPTPYFLGLRECESSGNAKRFEYTLLPAQKSDAVAVDRALPITFEFIRREWEYALVRTANGRWKREWKLREIPMPHLRRTVTVPAGEFRVGGTAELALDMPSGEYTLIAGSGDVLRTRLDFTWYAGDGGGRSGDPNSLYFRTDAEKVRPGENVTFAFDAAGAGEAFIVCGAGALSGHRVVPVHSGENRVTLKVPSELHRSSFFVGCTVVVRDGEKYRRNFGVLTVKVDQTGAHRLTVGLKHPELAEPETAVPVTVTLRDAAGRPQSGMVCLYAVDSGVTALTDYRAPDIFGRFYGESACPLDFYDMYGMLFEDLKITPDGRIGGDGMGAKLVRLAQKRTARLIAPPLEVPASGTATVSVRLPDHTGAMDVFAVAGGERAVGSEQSRIVLRRPVTVTVAAPRCLAPGDTAELAFTVFNNDSPEADYSCAVDLPPMLTTADGRTAVFTGSGLVKGSQRTHTLRVRALEHFASGRIAAALTVGAAGARDEAHITVRSVNVAQTASRLRVLKPGETFHAEFEDDYVGRPEGTIRLSASPALPLRGALEWLNAYPHGCLEQTAAGAFPFIVLPELVDSGLIDAAVAATNRHKIAGAYARLLAMARWDGSFSMWPGGEESWDAGTVFALHFIFEAQKRSLLTPDPATRETYLRWLRGFADAVDPEKRALRAYAVYVLAVAGDPAFVIPAHHIISATVKPDYPLFLAGAALVRGGCADKGAPAVRDALKAECWREANVPTAYSDTACRLGMTLRILTDCAIPCGDLPDRLALELAKSVRPDGSAWGTTQANAWAALGLAAYAGKNPPRPAAAAVTAAGQTAEVTVSGLRELPAANGTTVVNKSSGRLIVESRITGIPRRTPPDGGRLILRKEFFDAAGKPITGSAHGGIVYVRLTCESPAAVENLVITDLLPAGLEIEDELLASRSAAAVPNAMASKYGALRVKRLEKRGDRFLVFGDMDKGKCVVTCRTRAVTRGVFTIPPLHAEAMYRPDFNGIRGGMGTFTVK